MTVVVDSSVAIKWALPEPGSSEARQLVLSSTLLAPDFLYFEVANVLWRETRRGGLGKTEADGALQLIRAAPLTVTPTLDLVDDARLAADAIGLSLYASVYVALALRQAAALATADRRMADAVEAWAPGTPVIRIGIS